MFLLDTISQKPQGTTNERIGYLSVDSKNNRSLMDYKPASQRKRKPIFHKDKQQQYCKFFNNNRAPTTKILDYGRYQQQVKLSQALDNRILVNYDFCGCEDQIAPCSIVEQSFLKNVSIGDMKMQYEIIEGKNSSINIGITNEKFKELKKQLYRVLPAKYPQMFHSHLNALLTNLGIMRFNDYSFMALAWIHYHCKLQYLTFFIFKDLKSSLIRGPKIIDLLQQGLAFYNADYRTICLTYRRYNLQKFIQKYEQSIGAIMVPISQYSKFLKLIYEKGTRVLIRLIANFLSKKQQEMTIILQSEKQQQSEKLQLYLRQLDWDSILKLL